MTIQAKRNGAKQAGTKNRMGSAARARAKAMVLAVGIALALAAAPPAFAAGPRAAQPNAAAAKAAPATARAGAGAAAAMRPAARMAMPADGPNALSRLALAPADAATAAPVEVRVEAAHPGPVIPRTFAGFSIEVDAASGYYFGPAGNPNRVFFQLLRNLGGGTVRIGGNSTDDSCWRPRQAPHPQGCHFTITEADIRGFARAAAATGWGLYVGVNLAQNDAHWAAGYGAAVARAMDATRGAKLLGFEFGNEPDLFPYHRLYDHVFARPKDFTVADYLKNWHAYAAAFHGQPVTAHVPFVGPAICCQWLGHGAAGLRDFLAHVGHQDLNLVTVHDYPLTHCGGQHPTIAQLLNPGLAARYAARARRWVLLAHHYGYPIRYGEGNSISCEGQNGVSNAFAATAWGVGWLFTNFRVGMTGANLHQGSTVISVGYHGRAYYYDAVEVTHKQVGGRIEYDNHIWPLYYAMYAFAKNAEGQRLLAADVALRAPLRAYAVRQGDSGPVTAFVVNHDLSAAVPVRLTAPGGERARLLLVEAPDYASRDVTYGGVKFSPRTGKLAGQPQWRTLRRTGGEFRFLLPKAAVAIVKISAR